MTKEAFVAKMAIAAGLNKTQAAAALKATLQTITDTLKKGDKVSFVGFGTFTTAKRAKRTVRNPKTGEKMMAPARKVVKFKVGKSLKDTIK